MTDNAALMAAAETAGLLEPDVLKIAREDLPPADAVADLKRRYPAAFKPDAAPPRWPDKQFRDMSKTEQAEAEREMLSRAPRREDNVSGMKRFWADAKKAKPDLEIPPEYR